MNKKIYLLSIVSLLMLPGMVFAQPGIYSGDIYDVINLIITVFLNVLWTIAIAFVIFMFVLAGFKFFTAQGESSKVSDAGRFLLWGIVGTAVIVLAWSVLQVVRNQLGL